jgi:DnaK suppressor protein
LTLGTTTLRQFRARLLAELDALEAADGLGAEGRRTVELDQQSVGRLSRMDALQQQAMANADHARRAGLRLRVRAALDRMDEDEYGYCTECGEPIPPGRLEIDPAVPTCVSCARG